MKRFYDRAPLLIGLLVAGLLFPPFSQQRLGAAESAMKAAGLGQLRQYGRSGKTVQSAQADNNLLRFNPVSLEEMFYLVNEFVLFNFRASVSQARIQRYIGQFTDPLATGNHQANTGIADI